MPLYLNWTPITPTLSEAAAVTAIVPETTAPDAGAVMLTDGGTRSGFPTEMPPSAAMETILSPTATLQTPFALLALAVVAVHPTFSSTMNSAAPSGSTLEKLPCHCRGAPLAGSTVEN